MLTRVGLGLVVAAAVALSIGAAPAGAEAPPMATADDLAAYLDLPVFRPTRRFGLEEQTEGAGAETMRCRRGGGTRVAHYLLKPGRNGPGTGRGNYSARQFGVFLYRDRPWCIKQKRVVVRKVRLFGRRWRLEVACQYGASGTRCPPSGRLVNPTYMLRLRLRDRRSERFVRIELWGVHLSAKRFVAIARSLKPVDETAPTVALTTFWAANRTVRCRIATWNGSVFCQSADDRFSGELRRGGAVELCTYDGELAGTPCGRLWMPAGTLRSGQTTRVAGVSCTPAGPAVTCTNASGKGFRITGGSVGEVGPGG